MFRLLTLSAITNLLILAEALSQPKVYIDNNVHFTEAVVINMDSTFYHEIQQDGSFLVSTGVVTLHSADRLTFAIDTVATNELIKLRNDSSDTWTYSFYYTPYRVVEWRLGEEQLTKIKYRRPTDSNPFEQVLHLKRTPRQ
ncbi:hypothetical protein RT717_03790 [Imperialibacter roseus]|uniref:Uncharacterized protein n=1 Tax=Imperialibacter roseus TaxID=1324217 RepID=A0ABZ0ITN1_9BACT|nr:hypothetical protein [Imperialibacter roseus]WOK07745.1 hypothetical protein RT717_03790 [Imperialibacter roseus]